MSQDTLFYPSGTARVVLGERQDQNFNPALMMNHRAKVPKNYAGLSNSNHRHSHYRKSSLPKNPYYHDAHSPYKSSTLSTSTSTPMSTSRSRSRSRSSSLDYLDDSIIIVEDDHHFRDPSLTSQGGWRSSTPMTHQFQDENYSPSPSRWQSNTGSGGLSGRNREFYSVDSSSFTQSKPHIYNSTLRRKISQSDSIYKDFPPDHTLSRKNSYQSTGKSYDHHHRPLQQRSTHSSSPPRHSKDLPYSAPKRASPSLFYEHNEQYKPLQEVLESQGFQRTRITTPMESETWKRRHQTLMNEPPSSQPLHCREQPFQQHLQSSRTLDINDHHNGENRLLRARKSLSSFFGIFFSEPNVEADDKNDDTDPASMVTANNSVSVQDHCDDDLTDTTSANSTRRRRLLEDERIRAKLYHVNDLIKEHQIYGKKATVPIISPRLRSTKSTSSFATIPSDWSNSPHPSTPSTYLSKQNVFGNTIHTQSDKSSPLEAPLSPPKQLRHSKSVEMLKRQMNKKATSSPIPPVPSVPSSYQSSQNGQTFFSSFWDISSKAMAMPSFLNSTSEIPSISSSSTATVRDQSQASLPISSDAEQTLRYNAISTDLSKQNDPTPAKTLRKAQTFQNLKASAYNPKYPSTHYDSPVPYWLQNIASTSKVHPVLTKYQP